MFEGRILVGRQDSVYQLAQYALEQDGSLYIILPREGSNTSSSSYSTAQPTPATVEFATPRPRTKKISYHTSGLIRYHNSEQPSIYLEPICAITQINPVVAYVVPDCRRLDVAQDVSEDEIIVRLDDYNPIQFSFSLAPWNFVPDTTHIAVRYEGMFALIMEISPPSFPIDESVRDHFITGSLSAGLPNSLMDEPTAFAAYHQRINGTRGLILYSPNSAGVYRIVCAVPMRVPPTLEVSFNDKSLSAVQLEPHPKRGTVDVKFRVKGKGGFIKDREVAIESIRLHAEL